MGRLFKVLTNIDLFNNSSPYNSAYSRIDRAIEKGELSKLDEMGKPPSSRQDGAKIKIKKAKEAA